MPDEHLYITTDADSMMEKPVIKNTRITVECIVTELAAGYTIADVLAAHPHLTKEQVLAAVDYSST